MRFPQSWQRARPARAWVTLGAVLVLAATACTPTPTGTTPTAAPSLGPAPSPSPSPTIPVPDGPTLTATSAEPAHFLLFLGGNLADLSVTRIEGKNADLSSQPLSAMAGVPLETGTAVFAPALAPDRRRVAYVEVPASEAADPNSSGEGSIVVQNLDGTAGKVIAPAGPSGENGAPSWSPDGSQIAFLKGDRLWLTAPDGTNQHSVGVSLAVNTHIAWEPDGKKLAVGTGTPSRLAVIDLATLTPSFIGPGGAQVDHPAFSPDGLQIAYGVSGPNALFVASADGSGSARQITTCIHPDCIRDLEPIWSPDGAFIAFVRFAPGTSTSGAQQVYVVASGGGEARPVTSGLEEHAFPTW